MKHICVLFVLLIAVNISTAQIPSQISWQGVLQDSQGESLDGNYDLTVKLYDVATGGTSLWSETHNGIAITDGFVNLILGSINDLNLSFDSQYWLEITIGEGTPLSRIMLTSVPYAMYAKKAPNEIQGEPLILRDSDGNMRMRFNPDEGIFEMFDDEEELWYSMQVNSPPEVLLRMQQFTHFSVGGTTEIRNEDGDLVSKTTTYYYEDDLTDETVELQEKFTYNDVGEIIFKEYNKMAIGANDKVKTEKKRFFVQGETEVVVEHTKNDREVVDKEMFFTSGSVKEEYSQKQNEDIRLVLQLKNLEQEIIANMQLVKNLWKVDIIDDDELSTSFEQRPTGFYYYSNDGPESQYAIERIYDPPHNSGFKQSYSEDGEEIASMEVRNHSGRGQVLTRGEQAVIGDQIITGNSTVFGNTTTNGNSNVKGNVDIDKDINTAGVKKFRITHPNDDTKYLQHAAIESNEVLNIYSGNVTTNSNGVATVTLPDYFDEINYPIGYRYQLTVISSGFARAIIYQEVDVNNQFVIKTDVPNVKVSWQVTAKRDDAYMQTNPFNDVINK